MLTPSNEFSVQFFALAHAPMREIIHHTEKKKRMTEMGRERASERKAECRVQVIQSEKVTNEMSWLPEMVYLRCDTNQEPHIHCGVI